MSARLALCGSLLAGCFLDIPPLAEQGGDGGATDGGQGAGGSPSSSSIGGGGEAGAMGCPQGCPRGTTLDERDGACVISAPQADCAPIELSSELTIRGSLCAGQEVASLCDGGTQRALAFRATCAPAGYAGYTFTASGAAIARMSDLSCDQAQSCLSGGGSVPMPLFTDVLVLLPEAECASEVLVQLALEPR